MFHILSFLPIYVILVTESGKVIRLVELLKRLETFVFKVNLFSFTLEFYKSSRSVVNGLKKMYILEKSPSRVLQIHCLVHKSNPLTAFCVSSIHPSSSYRT